MLTISARGERLYTSESDVCRRQILTCKDGPRTERIKIFLTPLTHNIGIQMNLEELAKGATIQFPGGGGVFWK